MNIKGLTRNILPIETTKLKESKKAIKSETATDRDANGQASHKEPERRKLSEEELKAAVEDLEKLDGIKNNNLTVQLIEENDVRFVLITDSSGKVVRRIPEMDLAQLLQNRTKDKGRIFDRAM